MRRNQWAAALFAVILFCCGVAAGVLADRYYDIESVSAKPTPENFRKHYIAHMRSRLDLTPAQVTQLQKIVDDTDAGYRAARETCRPAMIKVKDQHVAAIKAMLTPRQIPIYEQMVKEHEAHQRKQREEAERRGHRDHGGH